MAEIKIDSEWLVAKAYEAQKIITREKELGTRGSVSISAEALGKIKMIEEIFENKK